MSILIGIYIVFLVVYFADILANRMTDIIIKMIELFKLLITK